MKRFLGKELGQAARTKMNKQATTFTSCCGQQKVPGKALRAVTYMYPPGPRRTTKPE